MKAVIVDDEKDSRQILAGYLERYCPDVTVCGFGESVATGLEAIRKHLPDVVFLDIEMPYGNGFDLLAKAGDISFETVFVTAFDHYAIQALNQSAAYYLLKPVDIDELVKAVEKIKAEKTSDRYIRHARVLLENIRPGAEQKIMLPTMEGFEVVPVGRIIYCEAVDNFTRFHLAPDPDSSRQPSGRDLESPPLMICRTLKYFEDVLKAYHFLRIHRSHLINPDYVVRYSKGKGGSVIMKNNVELEVSAERKKALLGFFGKGTTGSN